VRLDSGKKSKPFPKNKLKQKWARGLHQVVEHLTNKHEALNSKPSTAKKIKDKIKGDMLMYSKTKNL
jgi:hypothetical protein